MTIRFRPYTENDMEMLRRFAVEPGLIGLDWSGFHDPEAPVRRFAQDGYLSTENGRDARLVVEIVESDAANAAGFVSWRTGPFSTQHWEIGIALLPQWRGRGIGWRAQAMLCDYLFHHTPAQRIQAGTHSENSAEQKALEKAGFHFEGVIRAAEFRAGQWRDGYLYSRLRTDPGPQL